MTIFAAFMLGGFCGVVLMALMHMAKESDESEE